MEDEFGEIKYLYNLVSFDEHTGGVRLQIQIQDHQDILYQVVSAAES